MLRQVRTKLTLFECLADMERIRANSKFYFACATFFLMFNVRFIC